jgi:hypothetical protein
MKHVTASVVGVILSSCALATSIVCLLVSIDSFAALVAMAGSYLWFYIELTYGLYLMEQRRLLQLYMLELQGRMSLAQEALS